VLSKGCYKHVGQIKSPTTACKTNCKEDRLTTVDTIKKRKNTVVRTYFILNDTRLMKTVMLGITDGTRLRGKPSSKRSDDIVDWYNCALIRSCPLTKSRHMWRKNIDAITGLNGSHKEEKYHCAERSYYID